MRLLFVRSPSQKADCCGAPRAWTRAVFGLILHLPGHFGWADCLFSERCSSADGWIWLLHYRWSLHADREAGVLHGAAKEAAAHIDCQQGPAAPHWYGKRGWNGVTCLASPVGEIHLLLNIIAWCRCKLMPLAWLGRSFPNNVLITEPGSIVCWRGQGKKNYRHRYFCACCS